MDTQGNECSSYFTYANHSQENAYNKSIAFAADMNRICMPAHFWFKISQAVP